MKKGCRCHGCKYMCMRKGLNANRAFSCDHPNQFAIKEYWRKFDLHKALAFIGFGKSYSNVPENNATPRWCPLKDGEDYIRESDKP